MISFQRSEDTFASWYLEDRSPEVYLDTKYGILHIDLRSPKEDIEAEFDEREIFIFYEVGTRRVIGFEVHAFASYWSGRLDELIAHLAQYAPDDVPMIHGALYTKIEATPWVPAQGIAFG